MSYIKQLEYRIFTQFGKKYLTVDYTRNNEHNHYTLSDVPSWVISEKDVRRYINSLFYYI